MTIERFADIPTFPAAAYTVDVPLQHVPAWMEEMERDGSPVDLEPDFQREHVWTDAQRSAYVEFLLRGGQSARTLYFNSPGFSRGGQAPLVVVDGKQRLTAILGFLNDTVPAFGTLYSAFTDRLPIGDVTLQVHVAEMEHRAEVLRWYLALNTGGTDHSAEELARVRALLAEAGRRG